MAVVRLQSALRTELKEPLGPVFTDAEELLGAAGEPVVAVGDVVTHHLLGAGRIPDVALVDARTEREQVDAAVAGRIAAADVGREQGVANPAATLTEELLVGLREAVADAGTVLLDVDGEEDLAALPAVVVVPDGGSVVYGQPGEGMVHVRVDGEVRAQARDLLGRLDGDPERLFDLLGV